MYFAKVKIANKKPPNTSTTINRTNSEFLTRELRLGKVCPFKSYFSQCHYPTQISGFQQQQQQNCGAYEKER